MLLTVALHLCCMQLQVAFPFTPTLLSLKIFHSCVLCCAVAGLHAVLCRFIVQDTVEENVARLSRERAAAMDMTAAVPVKGGAAETAQLTVREVATLVCSKWRDGRDG